MIHSLNYAMNRIGWMCVAAMLLPCGMTAQTLVYDKPAQYFEEALVLGNGTLGAAVYGGVGEEKISLNDLTLWTGEPCANAVYSPEAWRHLDEVRGYLDQEDYVQADKANRALQGQYSQNYQPLGQLLLTEWTTQTSSKDVYRRQLDLPTATAVVNDGHVERTCFVSAPDSVMVIRLRSMDGKHLNTRLSFSSLLPIEQSTEQQSATSADLIVTGYTAYASSPNYTGIDYKLDVNRGIHFRTIVRVMTHGGGCVKANYGQSLSVEDCQEALILVANVTSFNGRYKDPVREGREYKNSVRARIEAAASKGFDQLHDAHVKDFGSFFNRVSIDLGSTDAAIASQTTDKQLLNYTKQQQINPDLEELYFQFGRYLLISCSRTEGVPANLQGLWNEHLLPPWSCNYTTNINLEENYWPVEVANLGELHKPMLDFVQSLPESGAITAREYYNVQRGWCLGHNSDIWGLTNPVGRRSGDPCWASWNMGGAWVSTHLWEHYQFSLDKDFLRQAYPALRGAADFCLGWMIEKDGYLMTSPCTSPENRYLIPETGVRGATFYGGFADLAMIRECLLDTRAAARELGIDKAYCDTITAALGQLLPYRIGARGNLQEFYHDWEGEDPQHRHQSHLFGLYPGHHISVRETPELAKACARTLEIKGPKSTGWSTGWRVNLQARLHDGEKAYQTYRMLLTYIEPKGHGGGTYPNLLDAHSPFQIDGNFGGAAGVMEMLMQSSFVPGETPVVELLPALPEAWRDHGSVSGLRARGGYELSFGWENGILSRLTVTSRRSDKGAVRIVCGNRKWSATLKPGEQRVLLK